MVFNFALTKEIYWPEKFRKYKNKEETRREFCTRNTGKLFSKVVEYVYVRKFVDKNSKKFVTDIENGIRDEMYKLLLSADWMDDDTR